LVAQKNVLLAQEMTEKLSGTRHANGRDYWVLAHRLNSNEFLAFPITAAGVGTPVVSAVGSPHLADPADRLSQPWAGQLKVSPDGRRLACALNCRNGCPFELFDFDATTGRVSNPRSLERLAYHNGVSFSPDNTKLYVIAAEVDANDYYFGGGVIQYDLATEPVGRVLLSFRSLFDGRLTTGGSGGLQLGPDGRIYATSVAPDNGGYSLGRIAEPNRAGPACGFEILLFDYLVGQPERIGRENVRQPTSNSPNYMDHIFNGLEPADELPQGEWEELRVYPNPTSGLVNIEWQGDGACGPAQGHLSLYTAIGQELLRRAPADFGQGPVPLDLGGLAAGLYLARVEVGGRTWVRKVVVMR
jgi:Secretion system C-terminal sorting domain